jgi:hypothetical protein
MDPATDPGSRENTRFAGCSEGFPAVEETVEKLC